MYFSLQFLLLSLENCIFQVKFSFSYPSVFYKIDIIKIFVSSNSISLSAVFILHICDFYLTKLIKLVIRSLVLFFPDSQEYNLLLDPFSFKLSMSLISFFIILVLVRLRPESLRTMPIMIIYEVKL